MPLVAALGKAHRQLKHLAGHAMAQPLDRSRPLWEMWVVEGLETNRFAIITTPRGLPTLYALPHRYLRNDSSKSSSRADCRRYTRAREEIRIVARGPRRRARMLRRKSGSPGPLPDS